MGARETLTMEELIGRTLGHYRIVDTIGESGIGEAHRIDVQRCGVEP
jgi:hypothetical protein